MEEEKVDHPKHYNQYPIEVIDMMVSIWGKEKAIDFCIMNVEGLGEVAEHKS